MRSAVVDAIAPAYVGRVGSSVVLEAVDEALAQIVAAGAHLGELEQVKALWITAARRRVIDEHLSAESRHRGEGAVEAVARSIADELVGMTDEARARWRIREILGVLRGDQRRWAEAWFDEVLSSSRVRGAQPRGLADALGWTPAKTKTVSRRARTKMAEFIAARASGAVCDEQRAHLDAFIMAGRRGDVADEWYAAMLFHIAGCEDCWTAWHARRRELPGRRPALVLVPFEAVAVAAQACAGKLAGLAVGAHAQATALLTRAGAGGAAAGGVATLSGKTAAVCAGLMCAAAAGGEVAVVLSERTVEPLRALPVRALPVLQAEPATESAARRKSEVGPVVAPAPPPAPVLNAKVRETLGAPRSTTFRARAGGLPPASAAPAPPPPPVAPSPAQTFCKQRIFGC